MISTDTEFQKSDLKKALDRVKPATLPNQSFIPILACYCFSKQWLFAYNDSILIATKLKTLSKEVSIALPNVFHSLVAKLGGKTVKLSYKDNKIKVISGRSTTTLPCLPGEDFIFTPSNIPKSFKIKDINLPISALKLCLANINENPIVAAQMGVTLIKTGKGIHLYSTDNTTVSKFLAGQEGVNQKVPFRAILPKPFCSAIVSLETTDAIKLNLNENNALAKTSEGDIVFTKTIEDTSDFDFFSVFKNIKVTSAFSITPTTINAVERVALILANGGQETVELSISKRMLNIKAASDLGSCHEKVKIKEKIREVPPIIININSLKRGVKLGSRMEIREGILAIVGEKGKFIHLIETIGS